MQCLSSGKHPNATGDLAPQPHILLVVDGFPKVLGGGERIVLRLAELLPRFGYRASILTFRLHPDGEFQPAMSPCPLYLLPLTNTYGLRALSSAITLKRFLQQQNTRLVMTFFESSDLWAGLVTHLLSRAKLVWNRRDMGILRGSKHRLAYRAMRGWPDAVFAVSKKVANHVIAEDGVPAARVHVVHNGLDVELAPPLRQPRRPSRNIFTVGNIRKVKGHDLLIEAALQLKTSYPDIRFTIAGDILEPEYFQELEDSIAAHDLGQHFCFLGKCTALHQQLGQADIFVLPSRSEGFSNALLEAMAFSLPVVATDVGGNSEAIADKENGLLVPPEDPRALATAIDSLLKDREWAAELGRNARKTVERQFTTEAMMQHTTRILDSLLSGSS